MTRWPCTLGEMGPWRRCRRSSWRGSRRRGTAAGSRIAARGRGRRPCEPRLYPRQYDMEAGGQGKRRQGRANREGKDDDHEVYGGAGDPARKRGPSPGTGAVEELRSRVGPPAHDERIRDDDAEERNEQAADQEQEHFVSASDPFAAAPEERGSDHRDDRRPDDEGQVASLRCEILDGAGGRVDVREGVVRLVDEDEEEGKRPEPKQADDRQEIRLTEGEPDGHEPGTEQIEYRICNRVACRRPDQRVPRGSRKSIVIRNQRPPGDRHRDHEVKAEEEGWDPGERGVPWVEVGPFQDERDSNRRCRRIREPNRETFEPGANDRKRASEGEGRHDRAEDRDEEGCGRRAEDVADERCRGNPHHEEFEGRPPEELEHVQRRRDVGPAPTEDRPQTHHRRNAGATPVVRRGREHQAPDDGTDEGHERRLGEGQSESETTDADQQRSRGEDQEPDPKARPQDKQVEGPEDPQSLRDGFDAPFRRPPHTGHREAKPSAYISDWRTARARSLLCLRGLLPRMFH